MTAYTNRPVKIGTRCEQEILLNLNYDKDNKLVRISALYGKDVHYGCIQSFINSITDAINLMLKHNVPVDEIKKAMSGHRCFKTDSTHKSCSDSIARELA